MHRNTSADGNDPAQINWEDCPGIDQRPDRMGGAWCFKGTRITVASLFENLAGGASISEYLENFPDVGAERAADVLNFQAEKLKAVWHR